ncbi:MAG: hypothetical protein NVS2B16_22640 [Chloroflexota bacterium]
MALTIIATVLFLAHVAAWIAAPSNLTDSARTTMPEMPEFTTEAQVS